MLGRARSRAQALARLPCRVPRANNTPSAARPGRSRSHGRPSAGIIGFRRGCVCGGSYGGPPPSKWPWSCSCHSRCATTRRRRQASAPSCRAAARPTAPPARHHVLLPRGPRRRRVGSSPGVSGGPLPAVRQPRQDQSSSSSGLRFSATQLVPPPSSSSSRRSPTPCVHSIADAGPQNQPACRGPSRGAGWRPRHPACPGGDFFSRFRLSRAGAFDAKGLGR